MRFEYPAFAFRQQDDSPVEVAFVAHALEVLKWAGVPRKSDEMLTGYQRFLDNKRINQDIVPYFQEPRNCSPTALIVALRRDSGLGSCSLADDVGVGEVVPTKLVIEIDEDALESSDRVFEAALSYVASRLSGPGDAAESAGSSGVEELRLTEKESQDEAEEEAEEESLDEAEEADEEADSEYRGEDLVNLGSKTLRFLREMLDDRRNWVRKEFRAAIADFVKPALIIDGQHRVYGAAAIGTQGLPFIVCGLYDPSWEEQVFQFTVVNLKPRRIPPSVITSIAALSLTRAELDRVEARLVQAGIKMAEVTMMSLVAYDEKSPFASMVEMHVREPESRSERLGYGAMKRIAKVWYRGNRKSLTLIAKNLFDTNNVAHARARWRDERAWFDFFCLFWDEVRRRHPEELWEKSPTNHLLVGYSLWALQEAILTSADGQVPSHWKVMNKEATYEERADELRSRFLEILGEALKCFPSELWTRPWAKVSQDTNAGRKELADIFKKFIEEGQTSGRWKAWMNHPWFRIAEREKETL